MINAVRIFLLIIALGVICLAGFYFYKDRNTEVERETMKFKIMGKGVDMEIEDFKLTQEVKGNK